MSTVHVILIPADSEKPTERVPINGETLVEQLTHACEYIGARFGTLTAPRDWRANTVKDSPNLSMLVVDERRRGRFKNTLPENPRATSISDWWPIYGDAILFATTGGENDLIKDTPDCFKF